MKCAGFTLIELLVVIAVIALLIAISVPLLQNSRQHTKAIICRSNIRQLVFGLTIYETENETFPYALNETFPYALDDTLLKPPPGGYAGTVMYDRMGWWWFNYISDYTRKNKGKKAALWCPSRRIKEPKFDYVLHGNYGVNLSVCKSSHGSHAEFIGTPLSSSDIPHPSRTLLIVDSGYSLINWWHVTDVPPVSFGSTIEDTAYYVPGLEINKDKDLWPGPGQEDDAINGRHPNKTVNVGFADGHVDRPKAGDLFVEKIDAGYKNRIPLWLPR